MAKSSTTRPATPTIELVEVTEDSRSVLENLAQLYQYDFSGFTGADVDDDGRFGWIDWDKLFDQPRHVAYLIRVDGKIAGFATAYEGEAFRDPDERVWWMDEFFVMRAHRRASVGTRVARMLFDRLPGVWEIAQMAPNTAAQAFWRRVIGDYTGGKFVEIEMRDNRWHGPVQYFRA